MLSFIPIFLALLVIAIFIASLVIVCVCKRHRETVTEAIKTVEKKGNDLTSQLQALAQQHADGQISDQEFAAKKAELLQSLYKVYTQHKRQVVRPAFTFY